MRTAALFSLVLAIGPTAAAAQTPTLVELFTAQGCASCGDANAYVDKLADRPGVLALTFPVDYWDYLGWPDTFAKPEFDERQRAYVAHMGLREPYTPQVIVDGRAQAGGLQTEKIDKLLHEAAERPRSPPDIAFIGQRRADVGYGRTPRGGAEVWLVRYDPRQQEVTVRKGDNKGQTLVQRNVVRELVRLGAWRGRPTAYRLPMAAGDEELKTALIVQAVHGGEILAVARRTP
ncbi:DUF1223 domain-containing protein [Phenylobacterium sp.]|uniref:DUF1223 domain-containing protein n=1 Tax=Phenylobacterium sp. TaxID=1871053 RepID=UPI0035B44849